MGQTQAQGMSGRTASTVAEPSRRWTAKANVTDRSSPYAGKPVCLRLQGAVSLGAGFDSAAPSVTAHTGHFTAHNYQQPGDQRSQLFILTRPSGNVSIEATH